jgi:hypothetical protein
MSNVIYAPNSIETDDVTVGLFGSIEQGKAIEWQQKVIEIFKEIPHTTFLNPRRLDWDSSWGEDDPKLIKQIIWEQKALIASDLALFFFDPKTESPITLMELGIKLIQAPGSVIVCCPDGYWRKTNVVVTAGLRGVDVLDTFEEMIEVLAKRMLSWTENT